jgi:hypothetical protein
MNLKTHHSFELYAKPCGSWLACDRGISVAQGQADPPPSQASQLSPLIFMDLQIAVLASERSNPNEN